MQPTNIASVIRGRNAVVTTRGALITDVAVGDDDSNVFVLPGFIDLQVNGIDEIDFAIASDEFAIARALDRMTCHGTTGCLPTIVTAPLDAYDTMLTRVRRARELPDASTRCAILGVHLEGPFLGGAPGAHPQDLIRPVDLGWITTLLQRHGDLIAMMTIAPEADPGFHATRMLSEHGVLVSLGHSDCSYETAVAAADAGARAVTHLFNGMSGLAHRAPGLATAALLDDRLTPTIIADLIHVSAPALQVAFAATDHLALITDSVAPGAGVSGGMKIERHGDAVYLADGTMAGAVIHMDDAVRNVLNLGESVRRAAAMAASIPASMLARTDCGELTVGRRADCVLIDTSTFMVQTVYLAGKQISFL